jgi:hypothetical protein
MAQTPQPSRADAASRVAAARFVPPIVPTQASAPVTPPRPVVAPKRPVAARQPAPTALQGIGAAIVPELHAIEMPRRPPLFENRSAVVRAVIASEVLGKPLALRDE